ncbi:LysE/ArgO family amino acid transporter [Sporomusa sp. KB1]|jgi:L-lysine exporter family protein LysE/ArgO|uniref:LysE/ArgO family amino acid transporter n=1 Tax=Sporomusa sp. KB1 TaxID=943346 RepID=UPI0011A1F02D|nr:LysE family transporter [Sporomusa sp. KB1]TWH47728.1 L-lysine exporter family protein LysE/ArgO [Sporomusa sp. KB1]
MQSLLHGVFLAIGLILPLGVQNLFIFNQGATQPSFLRALPAVIAASVCDTLLILLAVNGVSLFLVKFEVLKEVLVGMGVIFLLYMGWLTWNNIIAHNDVEATKSFSIKQQIVFAATVSLFNPHAILDTIGVIGTSSANYEGMEKLLFTIACILVSWLWFFSLAATARFVSGRAQFTNGIRWINKLSAVFIWGSACYMVYSAI